MPVGQCSRGQRGGVQQAGRRDDLPAAPGEVQWPRDEGAEQVRGGDAGTQHPGERPGATG
ncbi:hypothetical protein OG819_54315 [Streptomyces sp. NBC_01549]|uniref:hypothetical protein n=1 Tax=Streptomyces sp. NBC_01549 TaxID=2975874 RepID=UPI00225766AC|nr:hypothetical protein [Streptomyces sp. NBC_01549]MCX4598150.1 hypothetical protein [Streptomyces sp. NBC_01549]